MVDGLDPAVGDDGGGVVAVAVPLGEADHRDAGAHRRGQAVERLPGGGREGGAQEQVLGRIAGDGELRDERDVGAGPGGVAKRGRDHLGVAVDVTDDRVELCQGDSDVSAVPRRGLVAGSGASPRGGWTGDRVPADPGLGTGSRER